MTGRSGDLCCGSAVSIGSKWVRAKAKDLLAKMQVAIPGGAVQVWAIRDSLWTTARISRNNRAISAATR
jgi:hypothetical protein